jgi:hypothetical protein
MPSRATLPQRSRYLETKPEMAASGEAAGSPSLPPAFVGSGVRGLREEIVHGFGGPPELAKDETLYRGEGANHLRE